MIRLLIKMTIAVVSACSLSENNFYEFERSNYNSSHMCDVEVINP